MMTTYRQFNRLPTHSREAKRISQLQLQGGQCALCDEEVTPADRHRFHIDHCHDTDRLRGLLCLRCNQAMAAIDRGDEWIERARTYRDQGVWGAV